MARRKLALALLITGLGFLLIGFGAAGADSKINKEVTFSKDVAPIFYSNCTVCHRPNDLAPMSLINYKDARPWAKSIKEKVVSHVMPPWHADPHYGEFANDRRLSQKEIDTIAAWVDQGAKEGNPKDLPKSPEFVDGWHIGKPDVVLEMKEEHVVTPEGPDDYLYFALQTNFTEDKWVQSAEALPGNRKVVHHIIAFITNPLAASAITGSGRAGQSLGNAQSLFVQDGTLRRVRMDAPVVDDGCGSTNKAGAAANRRNGGGEGGLGALLAGYAPGKDWEAWPRGMAKKVPKGSVIVFQMHYSRLQSDGKEQRDRSKIGLIFAKGPADKIVKTAGVSNLMFKIPAGADNHEVTACTKLDQDAQIYSFMPHMHVRGKDMKYEAIYPDGKRETLLYVPTYSFSWQTVYVLKKPLILPKGTTVVVTAHFDNSTANKYNPDPAKAVRWGDPTYDEMMIGWFDYVSNVPKADAAAGTGSR
ncbi:MAG: thiol-disulfide isomerase [Blastocatellia bacterium AA13]|nr:MAG: thiol-disulfide isomerase [Blastocatellia bacterium AA13]